MKRYQSHKIVEAAPIIQHGDDFVVTRDDAGNEHRVHVGEAFFARGEPCNGDYLVRYLPDGYLSWSPKDKFEDGYAAIP